MHDCERVLCECSLGKEEQRDIATCPSARACALDNRVSIEVRRRTAEWRHAFQSRNGTTRHFLFDPKQPRVERAFRRSSIFRYFCSISRARGVIFAFKVSRATRGTSRAFSFTFFFPVNRRILHFRVGLRSVRSLRRKILSTRYSTRYIILRRGKISSKRRLGT